MRRFDGAFASACFAIALASPADAAAYGYESPVSDGCHEAITAEALRRVRDALPDRAEPLASTASDATLVEELPFEVASDMRDIGAVALLLGVRDNDLKGRHGTNSTSLALVHGDADGQREHCLRRPSHDDPALDDPARDELPSGSELALSECRGFIRDKVVRAISEGLDTSGAPDGDRRLPLAVHLAFSGRSTVQLPVFYVYLGQALHTLQDSFTHTFRSDDRRRVKVVLNWSDFAEGNLDERRDGPPHIVAMDQCRDQDERLRPRLEDLKASALTASEDLLYAALAGSTQGRSAAVDDVLDDWMQVEPGCNFDNGWCEAPEVALIEGPGCACRLAPGARRSSPRAAYAFVFGCLIVVALRQRGSNRSRARGRHACSAVLLAVLLASTPRPLAAQDAPPPVGDAPAASESPAAPIPSAVPTATPRPESAERACIPGRQLACACPDGARGAQRCLVDGSGFDACEPCGTVRPREGDASNDAGISQQDAISEAISRLAVYASVGAALDNAALAFSGAGRYALSENWLLGADAEFNPWFSLATNRFVLGSANVYATLIRRYVISDTVALRSTLHLGTSVLLVDLVGAPAGSTGLYVGANLLGLELEIARSLHLVVDPADVAVPIPHLTGAPLSYRQYRFTIGLQIGP